MNDNNKFDYWVVLLVSIFLGYFGVDRFIIGDYKIGLIKLFTFGGCGFLWLLDIILFATKTNHNIEYTTSEVSKKIGLSILGFMLLIFIFNSFINILKTTFKKEETKKVVITESPSKPNKTIESIPTKSLSSEKLDKYIKESESTHNKTIKPTPTKEKIVYDSSITYNNLARNPDKYKGKGVVFTGKIIQVMESDTGNTYRIAINSNYDTVMIVNYFPKENENRLLENDIIRFNGLSMGLYTYKTVMGNSLTLPWVMINKIL